MLIACALPALLAVGSFMVVIDRRLRLDRSREKELADQKFALDQHAIVSVTDVEGTIVYANDRFCRISGYPRERLIGANHDIVRSGRQDKAFYRDLWATIGAGKVWHGEICNRNASGGSYWLESTVTPLKDAAGRIVQYIAICTDITARKRLEDELEGSRAFLQSVTQSMGEGVYALDAEGRCTFLNDEGERLIGWSFDEVRNQPLHDLIRFQDSAGAPIFSDEWTILRSIREGRKHQSDEQCFTHRAGRVFPVSVAAMPLKESGAIVGAVIVFQDITERRRIYGELEKSEQRLTVALSASSTGLWDYNPITDQAFYSDTWFRMLGYEPGEIESRGATFFSLMHPDDRAPYEKDLDQHMRGESAAVESEFRMLRADDSWAWIRSIGKIAERDARGRVSRLIGVHLDTTAAHQAQSELATAKDVAVRANQAKSDFLATMSHEIRTPMNAVIGLSHLLGRTELNPRQRDYLDKIQNASQALLAIINDILDFSKIEAGRLTLESVEFGLDDVLENVNAVISPKLQEKSLELIVSKAPDLPVEFVGDPLRLSQLLMNLLSNAAKFTPAGEILLTLEGRPLADDEFRLQVSVSDTGIGMSPDQIASLFRPFTQADASTTRRFGGTGLGLAICRQILHLMGGEIEVESVEGAGTTFTFHAPFRLASPNRLATNSAAALSGKRALVVGGDASERGAMREALGKFGLEVDEAGDGFEALRRLDGAEPCDVVLIDWKLPDLDGLEVVARLRGAGLRTPIFITTAEGRPALETAIAERFGEPRGVAGILEKPFSPTVLKECVLAAFGLPGAKRSRRGRDRRRASEMTFPNVRALLVEDNLINQQVATELLASLGIRATVASSGEEALEILAALRFDLILMDIQMPGMDGMAATRAIRSELGDRTTPIVAMTANAMAGDRERCLEAGMNDHVGKPIDPDTLALTLGRWLSAQFEETEPRSNWRDRAPKAGPATGPAGFDMALALRNLNGDQGLFTQLLGVFVEEHAEQGEAALAALAASDWRRLNGIAHALKGAASTLGAVSLARAAAELDASTRPGASEPHHETAVSRVATLVRELGLAVASIAAKRGEGEEPATPAESAGSKQTLGATPAARGAHFEAQPDDRADVEASVRAA